jgi:hypothetical protein
MEEAGDRFEEALGIIVKAWTHYTSWSHRGTGRAEVKNENSDGSATNIGLWHACVGRSCRRSDATSGA